MMKTKATRNTALDVFRGMAIAIMILVDAVPDAGAVDPLLVHSPWQGMTIADLAFPGFVFAMGASAAFSLGRTSRAHRRGKLLRRALLFFVLGVLFNLLSSLFSWLLVEGYDHAAFYEQGILHVRIFGVLQRLALTYAFGTMLALWLGQSRRLLVAAFALLAVSSLGYHLYAPEAPFDKMHNISQAVDLLCPGASHASPYYGLPFDPEGLYGTMATTSSTLFGLLAGRALLNKQKSYALPIGGIALLLLGFLWSLIDMVGKPLWTSPYALLNAGGDMLVLAMLSWLFDRFPGMHWCFRPFYAFGRNPLFFYLATNIVLIFLFVWPSPVEGASVYRWVYRNTLEGIGGMATGATLYTVLWCLLWWPLAEFFCRKGIVIKI